MFNQRFPAMPPATQMMMPSGSTPTPAQGQALMQNPEIRDALLANFMRQMQGQQQPIRPAQVPQVVQPDLGEAQQQPMGMNPMLAQIMQKFSRPGAVRAAATPGAVPADVMMTQPM